GNREQGTGDRGQGTGGRGKAGWRGDGGRGRLGGVVPVTVPFVARVWALDCARLCAGRFGGGGGGVRAAVPEVFDRPAGGCGGTPRSGRAGCVLPRVCGAGTTGRGADRRTGLADNTNT